MSKLEVAGTTHRKLDFRCVLIVGLNGRRRLRIGCGSFRRLWSRTWRKIELAWRWLRPERLEHGPTTKPAIVEPTPSTNEAPSRMNGWLH